MKEVDVLDGCVIAAVLFACGISFATDEQAEYNAREEAKNHYEAVILYEAMQSNAIVPDEDTLMPANHDPRFMVPESRWIDLYCAKHDAGACEARK